MALFEILRLATLLVATFALFLFYRKLFHYAVRGLTQITIGLALIMLNMFVGSLFHSHLLPQAWREHYIVWLGGITGYIGQNLGIVLFLWGAFLLIRFLRPYIANYFTEMIQAAPTGMFFVQKEVITYANPSFSQMFGYSAGELEGRSIFELVHPEDRETFRLAMEKWCAQTSTAEPVRVRGERKNGDSLNLLIYGNGTTFRNSPAIHGTAIDVTGQHEMETRLRESEERYRKIIDIAPDAIVIHSEGKIKLVNEAAVQLVGASSADELLGRPVLEFLHPDYLEVAKERIQKALASFEPIPLMEEKLLRKDGRVVDIEVRGIALRFEDKPAIMLIVRDIGERKQANLALRASEEKYRSLFQGASDAIFLMEGNVFVDCNRATEKMFGCHREDIIGHTPVEFSPPFQPDGRDSYSKAMEKIQGALDGKRQVFEWVHIQKNGTPFFAEVSLNRYYSGKNWHILAIVRDISLRKEAETALKESEEKYRSLFEESQDTIYISTPEGKLLDINPAGVELFGYQSCEELLAADITHDLYVNPSERERALRILEEKGKIKDFEITLRRKDGSQIVVLETTTAVRNQEGEIVAYRGILRDVTEKKQLEQQLFQAQKMESIGTLAGGIAHDFNNILGGILGYASFMKMKMKRDDPNIKYLDVIEKSTQRASELTGKLLAFARGGRYNVQPLDLNTIVEETLSIIERTFDKAIDIQLDLLPSLPRVEADATQIQQVIMNVCVNARDAMPDGGTLTIRTGTEQVQGANGAGNSKFRSGQHVVLSIKDTGIGMDEQTKQRIFEPFFTTKSHQKGSGLGMAMVYGVVKNHGGFIRIESAPQKGSEISIYLPAMADRATRSKKKAQASPERNKKIMIVDDEENIRMLLKDILETQGYKVLCCADGMEALQTYKDQHGEIGLVILDMIMPRLGGRETFLKMKEINPEIRCLLSSGYSQEGKAQQILRDGVLGFIQKPFQAQTILQSVQEVLQGNYLPISGGDPRT